MTFPTSPSTQNGIRLNRTRNSDNLETVDLDSTVENISQNIIDDANNDNDNADDDGDDDIQIIGSVTSPSSLTAPITQSISTGLAHILQSQQSQQQRRIRRDLERQRLRQQRLSIRNRRISVNNVENINSNNNINNNSDSFYINPNNHIYDDNQGPILITSDTEDLDNTDMNVLNDPGFYSDTATVGSTDTSSSRVRMALSADERSIRNARALQREHLRNLLNNQNTNNNNNNNHNHNTIPFNDINDDEIQFVGEREIPDVQVISSQNTGFNLYTPSGPLFVPSTETRHGGGRVNMIIGQNQARNETRRRNNSNLRSFIRPDRSRQETLRQQQIEANRRARNAAANGGSISERVHRRSERNNNDNRGTRNVRPRNHPQLTLNGFTNIFRLLHSIANNENGALAHGNGALAHGNGALFEALAPINDFLGEGVAMNGNEDIPANVMRILQSRDEERENERIRTRNKVANTEKNKKAKEAKVDNLLKDQFTNTLGLESQDDVCVLCGITLLQGVPDQYAEKNGKSEITTDDDIKKLIKEGFMSPWNAWERFTNVEIDLSKKVFFGACGHIYCGRCVNNIMRFRGMTARERRDQISKVSKSNENPDRVSVLSTDFENPAFSAPLKCIARGCTKKFTGKTPFNELYV